MNLKGELPELIRQESPGFDLELPEDAVLIGSRLGDWHWFIRCHDSGDSPVWSFGISGEHQPQLSCDSFVEWLFACAVDVAQILERSQRS